MDESARLADEMLTPQAPAAAARAGAMEPDQVFRDTFELAAVGILHTGVRGQLLRANPRACEMLGYTAEELSRLSFLDITHPDDVSNNATLFRQILAGKADKYHFEKRYQRKNGHYLWVNVSVSLKRSATGSILYMITVIEDITEKKRNEAELTRMRDSLAAEVERQTSQLQERNDALRLQFMETIESEHALRQSQQRLSSIANAVPAMIGYWSRDLRCEFANKAYREWFGRTAEQIEGMSMKEFMGAELFALNEPHVALTLAGQAQRFERRHVRPDASVSITDVRYVPDISETGEVRGFHALVTDVTALRQALVELEAAHARLLQESVLDYLTGLSNRRVFSERSEAAAKAFASAGVPYGLILMDLDDFKHINDDFGHDVGDEVLRALGRILSEQLRGREDIAARLGGEEFAVLCFGELDETALCNLAERIRVQLSREGVTSPRGMVHFTSSFGVALCSAEDSGWRNIYARADAALYEAKASGKDRIVFGHLNSRTSTGRLRALQRGRLQAGT
ncbi:MAG TPA: diguanylate cyclase [Steroidobacteraceae bacterium]|nr:diguanylate cyclase [Steroidobacteraceae bacterium]